MIIYLTFHLIFNGEQVLVRKLRKLKFPKIDKWVKNWKMKKKNFQNANEIFFPSFKCYVFLLKIFFFFYFL